MIGLSLGLSLASQSGAGGAPTPTPTPGIPAAADRVAHWDATTITPQADNTNLASWTDQINGLSMAQATSANQPKYRTGAGAGGIGGQPCVQFDGNQLFAAPHSGTALRATLETGTYTVLAIVKSAGAQVATGAIFAAATTKSGLILGHTGRILGLYDSAERALVDFNTFSVFGITGTTNTTRLAIDGGIVGQNPTSPKSVTGTLFQIGGIPGLAANLSLLGSICEIVFYNRQLTPRELFEFDDYARAKYDQPNPRAGLGKLVIFEGDSITSGVGADYFRYNYPVVASGTAGLAYGQYTNVARGGATWANITTQAPVIDDLMDYMGATPVHLVVWEFYNHRALATVIADYVVPYLTARKAAGVDRITFGTTLDYTGAGAEKAAYTDYWDNPANRTGLIDDYVPLHDDATLGVDGAAASTTYFLDGVHLTGKPNFPTAQSGYPVLASLFEPYL